MSAQDRTENVLRDLHVLLAKSEIYDKEKNLVIVDKKEVISLLTSLNKCIYEIMDEYELTNQSREKAERAARKRGESIIQDAGHKAEDVYAASVLYSDEALKRVQDIMQETMDSVKQIFEKAGDDLQKEKQKVRENQSELKSCLQDMQDTKKYLNIIEERNKQIAKEKQKEKEEEPSPYAAVKPEIKINETYFKEHGLSIEEEEEQPEEKKEPVTAEVNVNLDSEYFKWKEKEAGGGREEASEEKRAEKRSLFGKKIKNEKQG